MLCVLLIGLLTVAGVFFGLLLANQDKTSQDPKRAPEELQLEESRVFDFLHGLGETFTGDVRVADLHRLMVEGAMRILDAHGGALYLADRSGKMLLPAFLSKGCPPLVDVPRHILQQSATTPMVLESFLRLHTVKPDEGLIGMVWGKREPVFLSSREEKGRLENLKKSALQIETMMVATLIYARH